jgi:hypothetical protein
VAVISQPLFSIDGHIVVNIGDLERPAHENEAIKLARNLPRLCCAGAPILRIVLSFGHAKVFEVCFFIHKWTRGSSAGSQVDASPARYAGFEIHSHWFSLACGNYYGVNKGYAQAMLAVCDVSATPSVLACCDCRRAHRMPHRKRELLAIKSLVESPAT